MAAPKRAYDTFATRTTSFLTACIIRLHVSLITFCGVASAADGIFEAAALARLFDAPAGDELSYSRSRCTQLAGLKVRHDDSATIRFEIERTYTIPCLTDATTPDAATEIDELNVRHVGRLCKLLKFSVISRRTRRKNLEENIHIISDEASVVISPCGDVA